MRLRSRIPGVSVLLASIRTLSSRHICYLPGWLGFPYSSVGKESACNAGDPSSIPGSGRSPGEGKGSILAVFYPLSYSGLDNSMDWLLTPVFLGFPCRSAGKESVCNVGDLGLIPGLGRSPGERKGSILAVFYPLQYSGLENSMDCIVHGVAKSWT